MKPKKSLRVLCVGRLSTEKCQDVLIKALGTVKNSDISLTIAGDGPQLESYKELVENYSLQDRVHFLGNQENRQIAQLMQEHDVLALVSYRFDNQPMVILEAITAGMPVLYCDPQLKVGLMTENSLLTKDESAQSIAAGLEQYYNMDTAGYRKMSEASLVIAEQFSSEKFAKKTIEVYRSALHQE